jgi:hypothetical protein
MEELRILKESAFWQYLSSSTRNKVLTYMHHFCGSEGCGQKLSENRIPKKAKAVNIMTIPVVLKDGKECNVSKDELQVLMKRQKVLFFERSDGWAVVGRDVMRNHKAPLVDNDRRENGAFTLD